MQKILSEIPSTVYREIVKKKVKISLSMTSMTMLLKVKTRLTSNGFSQS